MRDWDEYWRSFEPSRPGRYFLTGAREKLKHVLLQNIDRETKILEVGTGSGDTLNLIRMLGYTKILSIDNSKEAIKYASSKYPDLTDRMMCVEEGYSFSEDEFDIVFSEGVLEHYQDPAPIIREWKRISKRIILLQPTRLFSLLQRVYCTLALRPRVNEYIFTKSYYEDIFRACDLYIEIDQTVYKRSFWLFMVRK